MHVSKRTSTNRWLSIYLYPSGSPDSLLAAINTLVTKVKSANQSELNWFFIRYQDWLGPHLRLRIKCTSDLIRRQVTSQFEQIFDLTSPPHSRQQRVASDHLLRRVRQINYRPEIGRYGGYSRIAISERFFKSSSEWVLKYIDLLGSDYDKRLLTSAIGAYILLFIAIPDKMELARIAAAISEAWIYTLRKRQLLGETAFDEISERWAQDSEAWHRSFSIAEKYLDAVASNSPLGEWGVECRARITELNQTYRTPILGSSSSRTRIIQSWAHMHLNRMGITNVDEALFAFSLAQYLAARGAL